MTQKAFIFMKLETLYILSILLNVFFISGKTTPTGQLSNATTEKFLEETKNSIKLTTGLFGKFNDITKKESTTEINIRLIEYTNSQLKISNTTTCDCPVESGCTFLKNIAHPCRFSFTFILSAPNNINFFSTDFYPITAEGLNYINTIKYGPDFKISKNIQSFTKPLTLNVYVHNLGMVIDIETSKALYIETLTLVDVFSFDIRSKIPSLYNDYVSINQEMVSLKYDRLVLEYSIQCNAGFYGTFCDFQCWNENTNLEMTEMVPTARKKDSKYFSTLICRSVLLSTNNSLDYMQRCKKGFNAILLDCEPCNFDSSVNTCLPIAPKSLQRTAANDNLTIILILLLIIALVIIAILLPCLCCQCCRTQSKSLNKRDDQKPINYNSESTIEKVNAESKVYPYEKPFNDSNVWTTHHCLPPAAVKVGLDSPHYLLDETNSLEDSQQEAYVRRKEAFV